MSKRILITGCNGFIGSHLVHFYRTNGYEVYGLDINISNTIKDNCTFLECDLQTSNLCKIFNELFPDIFIHCAGNASVGKSMEYPEMDFNSSVTVLYKVLSALVREKLNPRFIFLSSAAVYGNPNVMPIDEETATSPISPYGLHKKICEDLCKYYRDILKQNISVARIFSAYGEGLRKQILWDMYNKLKTSGEINLFGTGKESRDFIFIDDIVHAIDIVIHAQKNEFIYNVACGVETRIRDLAEIFVSQFHLDNSIIKFNGQTKLGDPINWRADISKIESLGFIPKVDIGEGVKRYVSWLKGVRI